MTQENILTKNEINEMCIIIGKLRENFPNILTPQKTFVKNIIG